MTLIDAVSWWKTISGYGSVWLLNYLIHSSLLLGAVWVFVRFRRPTQAFRDILWKTALVGGVVTATFQLTGWTGQPPGSWSVPISGDVTGMNLHPSPPNTGNGFSPAIPLDSPAPELWQRVRTAAVHGWPQFLMGIWGMGTVLCGARLFLGRMRLYRGLHPRSEINQGPARELLDHLCRSENVQRRIRLTVSPRIGGPVALGRSEICLPDRALGDLDREQLYPVLAHELAHLLRGDPVWRWVSAGVVGVFFFQPLNRMARRHLQETAEFLCDDWTVERTGEGVTLARCLVEVAAWLRPFSRIPAAGMAERGSTLVQRVERLLSDGKHPGGNQRRQGLAMAALLGVVVMASPGFVPYATTPGVFSPLADDNKSLEPRASAPRVWIHDTTPTKPVIHLRNHTRHQLTPLETPKVRRLKRVRTLKREKQDAVKALFLEVHSQESRFTFQLAPKVLYQLEQLNLEMERASNPLPSRILELEDRREILEKARKLIQELLRQQQQEHHPRIYQI